MIAAADEVLDNGAVGEAAWQACAEHLPGNEERLELVAAICNWNTFSIMLKSLNIPLEDGIVAWPPEGMPSPAADSFAFVRLWVRIRGSRPGMTIFLVFQLFLIIAGLDPAIRKTRRQARQQ